MGTADLVRVVLIDDHPLYRVAVQEALERSRAAEVVCAVASVAEAHPFFEQAEVVLLDWSLSEAPDRAVKAMLEEWPALRIVVMSAADDGFTGHSALCAGAIAFLPKTTGETELLAAVHYAAAGFPYIPPFWGARVLLPKLARVRANSN